MFDIDFFLFFIMRENWSSRKEMCVGGTTASSLIPLLHYFFFSSLAEGWIYTRSAAAIYMLCFRVWGGWKCKKICQKKIVPRDAWNESRFLCCCEYNNFSFAQTLDSLGEGGWSGVAAVRHTKHTTHIVHRRESKWAAVGGSFWGEKRKIHKNLIRNWII